MSQDPAPYTVYRNCGTCKYFALWDSDRGECMHPDPVDEIVYTYSACLQWAPIMMDRREA